MNASTSDLTDRSQHFDFGKNWAGYSRLIDEKRREAAEESVKRLVPDIEGKSFLDIGSGSGLFSLAALRLGAGRVVALDIDEDSVATTRKLLAGEGEEGRWTAARASVFDLSPDELGTFDVVYSWGVLHHTGDMWRAIDCASKMVGPGGTFAFALYERTPLCGAWRVEKRAYMNARPGTQKLVRNAYVGLRRLARTVRGRGSELERGMDMVHDAHDWLGGYPYESTSGDAVLEFMRQRGFDRVLEQPVKIHLAGLLGTGCSEYVYRRKAGA
jgi:2-polyprenyl-6-hydroxyphenyl methylase/3-demethylubiquinone-9 3-methyltransferase